MPACSSGASSRTQAALGAVLRVLRMRKPRSVRRHPVAIPDGDPGSRETRPGMRGDIFSGVLSAACLCVSPCVCLSVRERISGTTRPIFTQLFVHVARGHGSVFFCQRCDTLCTSGFADNVTIRHARRGRPTAWSKRWLWTVVDGMSRRRPPKTSTFPVRRRNALRLRTSTKVKVTLREDRRLS